MRYTLERLIEEFRADPHSPFAALNHAVRVRHIRLYERLIREHGRTSLKQIRPRDLIAWHRVWVGAGKVAIAHSLISRLRVLFRFGEVFLEDRECRRLSTALSKIRFEKPALRGQAITNEQIVAFRTTAHQYGFEAMSLAQALQYDLHLSQKDVIGIYVPVSEAIETDVVHSEYGKWHDGLRWSDLDEDLNLFSRDRKGQATLTVNLRKAPMVMQELAIYCDMHDPEKITRDDLARTGPIILNEQSAFPYTTAEFRRKWRIVANYAQLPKTLTNKDSKRLQSL
ncbi:hypothetical protein [Bradyrhizobium sp. CCGB20]|uniref:hypothetical protein n=1 Tax=Bradyrhizobium sp. CCGB20 TaxID=2949633 RepID=UPI0020B1E569|nr:hypothetical protein [Bradyrhizobium sp. CCGB20]MCP3397146.1 hypothetical protein [Bradyrhizobium sp. CCGB20]